MNSTLSISGKNVSNINIMGKNQNKNDLPEEIRILKKNIINKILLPIASKQWKKIEENMFSFEKIAKQIDKHSHEEEDLLVYKDILKALEQVVYEHKQLEELEKTMYGSASDISTLIYKTTMIRLKPEYEIYDAIFKKPSKSKGEKYNEEIIQDIERSLEIENIDFDRIKEIITRKYINSE
jgi:hypothetical protein